jgi:hypothetical protein
MERQHHKPIEGHGLRARPMKYKYRFCPRCRREWPSDHKSCPECVHWLGDQPLERTEWQLVPAARGPSRPAGYEQIGASAVVLRVVSERLPNGWLAELAGVIKNILLATDDSSQCAVEEHGWLVWSTGGLRRAFLQGLAIEQRLATALTRLDDILHYAARFRWGIWVDQYVLPVDQNGAPAIADITARAIFVGRIFLSSREGRRGDQ